VQNLNVHKNGLESWNLQQNCTNLIKEKISMEEIRLMTENVASVQKKCVKSVPYIFSP